MANDIDHTLESALNSLRRRYHHLDYRFKEGVWLSPLETFARDIIPVIEAFLKHAYDAFHNEPWTSDAEFKADFARELEMARKVIEHDKASE
jgi:hypothetical protein